jgi:Tol biopolymer transport system component
MNSPRTSASRTLLAAGLVGAFLATGAPATAGTDATTPTGRIDLVTVSSAGVQAQGKSSLGGASRTLSGQGRYVVFSSPDEDLVRRDRNGVDDVFVRDRRNGTTRLVSVTAKGRQADDHSIEPTISANGRYVAFTSFSDKLVRRDRNGVLDVFVKDLKTGRVKLVSQTTAGRLRDRNSFYPQISADGQSVAFQTFASFAVTDDDRREDVYVRNLPEGTTHHVSLNKRDVDISQSVLVGGISDDGSRVSFGNRFAVMVRDLTSERTYVVHRESGHDAAIGRPTISGNGKYIAFASLSPDLVPGARGKWTEVVRADVATGDLVHVSVPADGRSAPTEDSFGPTLDRTGDAVAFVSISRTIFEGDGNEAPDVFVRDIGAGTTTLVSATPEGEPGNSHSGRSAQSSISRDGNTVVFSTYATDLGFRDRNNAVDIVTWTRR